MKKIISLAYLIFLALTLYGQTETEILKKAEDLKAAKKYESAFKVLDDFDPHNSMPGIVLLKEDIALNYFVTSIMHQMFTFKDLEKNEDIMDYRGKEGSFSMYTFEIDKVLDSLIKVYPENCKLYKGLGDYYFETYVKYGDEWLKKNDELFGLIGLNDKKAIDGGCADYLTYYVLGFVSISQKQYSEGIPYFLKSIEMNAGYADSYYNLAYAYLFTDDRANALKYAKRSLDLYTVASYKSDAARMIGQIYMELKDDKNAATNYELANKIEPGNYYNIRPLLYLYVKTDNKKTKELLSTFFNLAPSNPTIYNDLEDIFYSNKKESDLTSFYKEQMITFKEDKKVLGNLNFYLGKICLGTDKKLAKEYFLKAKDIFGKVYDTDHQVFDAIDEGIKEAETE